MTIKTLKIVFDIPLRPDQIKYWRGAIAEYAGWEDDRFHNHIEAHTYRYRFPTIMYRSEHNQAALWAWGEGVEAIQEMLLSPKNVLTMQGKTYRLHLIERHILDIPLSMSDQSHPYFLHNWLALNEENFKKWDNLPSLTARTAMLEQVLASNIIAFAKAIHWQLPQRLEVTLLQIRSTHTVPHKGVPMVAFDVSFSANIVLPDGLGLGKAVSMGYGVVEPLRPKRPRKKVQTRALAFGNFV